MSAQRNSPWTAGFQARRQGSNVNPSMRVSDAERADVSERLSRHYGDGRLDQAEFDERMGRAMNARTHGDFAGLFADLPDLADGADQPGMQAPVAAAAAGGRPRSPLYRIALIALFVVAAVVVSHALVTGSFVPWLIVALVVYLLLRGRPGYRNRI